MAYNSLSDSLCCPSYSCGHNSRLVRSYNLKEIPIKNVKYSINNKTVKDIYNFYFDCPVLSLSRFSGNITAAQGGDKDFSLTACTPFCEG
ncbi:unnamed protein product [Ceratitis capitata]|uniref:(Mediterranean fruit fly) hypothetical protein n=1 Tax=Ceratitis capitata TaxID=7213 RepID=A0A811V296_CERCA|nr:unnamed protein product [Ceratitis capitata]